MKPDAAFQRRVMRVFEDMLDQPLDRQKRWLDGACPDEPAVREAVRAMDEASRSSRLLPTIVSEPAQPGVEEPPPERIGQYRVTGELGRGGMGIVYLGERDDGLFDHKVAIKLMRRAVFSERALEQFAIERRILARLRHPHIAQMLDGGVTGNGASYIIMELISGTPITDYCDANSLNLHQRLALFRDAALAIEHAHRNLIVHADIKPSNVIVEEGFGVKLLDFGIARLLDESEGAGHGAYTPGFASPARIAGLPPTPADDIFAAGTLLRTLTSGTLEGDEDLAAVLDKATASDPDARYGAISELVGDLDRWQAHKPILAHRPSTGRRAYLFWRRNRLALILAGLASLGLITVATTTTLSWLRAEQARTEAEQRFAETRGLSRFLFDDVTDTLAPIAGADAIRGRIAERAERSLARLAAVPGASPELETENAEASIRVGEILAGLDQRSGVGSHAANDALVRAERILEHLVAENPNRADLVLLLVRTLTARAKLATEAENNRLLTGQLLDEADRRLRAPALQNGRLNVVQAAQWDIDLARASMLDRSGAYQELLPLAQAMLSRNPVGNSPTDARQALRLELSWTLFGNAQWYAGKHLPALADYERAAQALTAPDLQSDARVIERRAFAAYDISSTLTSLDRKREALAEIEGAAASVRELRRFDDSSRAQHIEDIVVSEHAVDLSNLGQNDAAIAESERSVAISEVLARLEPDNYDAVRSVPIDLRPLSEIYRSAGRITEACATARQAKSLWREIARSVPLAKFDAESEQAALRSDLAGCS